MNTQTHISASRPVHDQPVSQRRLIRAAAVVDAASVQAAPGAILVEGNAIIAAGSPESIGQIGHDVVVEHYPNSVLVPALGNAHAHLDLTHIGPIPWGSGVNQPADFVSWIELIRGARVTDEHSLRRSVMTGVQRLREGGTAVVGDIAGIRSLVPLQTMRDSGMAGVSFLEVFGLGRSQQQAVEGMTRVVDQTLPLENGVRVGLQPHAPYSCGPEVFHAASQFGVPLATHLAETSEELRFVRQGDGPLADMLRRFGVWDETIVDDTHAAGIGAGLHAVEWLLRQLGDHSCIAAHVNYLTDREIEMLASSQIVVAYCPRASTYFGHAGHKYRMMIDAGVQVALGTDSIVCLDTPDRISVLDEMRLLSQRDGTDPLLLLRMGTVAVAAALGMNKSVLTFSPGPCGGILAIDANSNVGTFRELLTAAIRHIGPPRWIVGPVAGKNQWFE